MGVFFGVRQPLSSFVAVDNFSEGIGNWTADPSDADATMDWYENDSLRISINTGSSAESDRLSAFWNNGLVGNFDIEVEYKRLTTSGSGSRVYGFYVSPSPGDFDNHIFVVQPDDSPTMRCRYRLSGSTQEQIDNSIKPDPTLSNLRLRIVKVGSLFTTYHDNGDGIWNEVGQLDAPPFESTTMIPALYTSRFGATALSVRYDNFKVVTGTLS